MQAYMIQMKQKVSIKMLLSISISASVYTTQIAPHGACNRRCESLTDCLNNLIAHNRYAR